MRAYDETYLAGAQRRLGTMLDVAVNGYACDLGAFYDLFLKTPIASRFGAGDPAIVAGRSGEELVFDILGSETHPSVDPCTPLPVIEASEEYWTGWALAFYQWASGAQFASIQHLVPIGEIRSMYHPYHEMDVRQFCDKMDELRREVQPRTNLQERRLAAGLSQSQLARASGIPVRTLQQYEQRQKDVNRARSDYLVAISRALCCQPADLLEHQAGPLIEYAVVSL